MFINAPRKLTLSILCFLNVNDCFKETLNESILLLFLLFLCFFSILCLFLFVHTTLTEKIIWCEKSCLFRLRLKMILTLWVPPCMTWLVTPATYFYTCLDLFLFLSPNVLSSTSFSFSFFKVFALGPVSPFFPICFKFNDYQNISGILEKINPRNGLCEHSAEGNFKSGVLEGKIRFVSNDMKVIYSS